MGWYRNLNRREFLKTATAAALASGVISCSSSSNPWRFLTVDEARTLAALSDQIIPPDLSPGGDWARVVNFMDLQLCGPYVHYRETYRKGTTALEQTTRQQFGKSFAEITSEQQVALMQCMERNEGPANIWKNPSGKELFELILEHTMQGYYGDPRHGGNREHASWKMVGLSYPPIRGRMVSSKRNAK